MANCRLAAILLGDPPGPRQDLALRWYELDIPLLYLHPGLTLRIVMTQPFLEWPRIAPLAYQPGVPTEKYCNCFFPFAAQINRTFRLENDEIYPGKLVLVLTN